jgi:hypothetical protein
MPINARQYAESCLIGWVDYVTEAKPLTMRIVSESVSERLLPTRSIISRYKRPHGVYKHRGTSLQGRILHMHSRLRRVNGRR